MTSMKALVVDDTAVYRKLLSDLLAGLPDVEVVGTAAHGKIALDKAATLQPDLITLDIEMPVMDGIATLRALQDRRDQASVVVVSSLTQEGAQMTMDALSLGAFDFVYKPHGTSMDENKADLLRQLRPIMAGLRVRIGSRSPSLVGAAAPGPKRESVAAPVSSAVKRMNRAMPKVKPEIVAIAVSTGGPKALGDVIPKLSGKLRAPVVIAQHIPVGFSSALAESLNKKSSMTVKEGKSGDPLLPGRVYIAPGGKQMKVVPGTDGGSNILSITDAPPENHCKPSADYLMRSVAGVYGPKALGVIMTGMGADGVLGLKLMKRHNVHVIAQDEATSVVYGMPGSAVSAGVVDATVPLNELAGQIMKWVGE